MIKILAIETSCDDTGVAIIETDGKSFKTLSNVVSSQTKLHAQYGGVFPMLAKREHQKNLVPVLKEALKEAKLLEPGNAETKHLSSILEREPELLKDIVPFLKEFGKPDVDAIAVTNGPGLEPCLWVGVNFAKSLASVWNIPAVTVNHVKAHIFVNTGLTKKNFPAVCLIVSGGHTQLFLMKDFGKYEILGETRDDAAGECFDKTARILGLGYPGGPEIAKQAEKFKGKLSFKLPRPMMNTKDYDFSFSGLKTAVLYDHMKKNRNLSEMCFEIQQSVIDVLIKKTIKAARDYKAKTIILGGGVVANKELRKQFKERVKDIELMIPDPQNCTDNALMVAITGYFKFKNKQVEKWQDIEAKAHLRIE